jgi:alpha,alpha-trehalase
MGHPREMRLNSRMRLCRWILLALPFALCAAANFPPTPVELYGELFRRVQMEGVFPDDKDFVDSVPKRAPAEIRADYERLRNRPNFDLRAFVRENFTPPRAAEGVREHIETLWKELERNAARPPANGSLLALPLPYVVPGGRFEELYYWDSYFVMLGLRESRRIAMVENMVRNFAALIARYGFIPNASRTYYLTRSQPPFFSLMVDLLADAKDEGIYRKYRPALETEYAFWMDESRGHAVRAGGAALNRYHDRASTPREEQYRTDVTLSRGSGRKPATLFHELRSAAESGWDFSSRCFADGRNRATVRTTELAPVDLNSLLHHLEITLAKARRLDGDEAGATEMEAGAARRRAAINAMFWSDDAGWYFDYDLRAGRRATAKTLAGMAPFFLGVAPKERAAAAARTLKRDFLRPGGLVTTLTRTGEQWDAPNGWAPLQWMAIAGLRDYGQHALAESIARRWIARNIEVYHETGKLMEKYDVTDLARPGGGGEYPTQDGFGWTNGVLLKLMNLYGAPENSEVR